jgi:hypothetical protein
MVLPSYSCDLFLADTASMSSPIRPMGHSRLYADALVEGKQVLDLIDDLLELLVTTEDDVLLLEVADVNCMVTKVSTPVVPM